MTGGNLVRLIFTRLLDLDQSNYDEYSPFFMKKGCKVDQLLEHFAKKKLDIEIPDMKTLSNEAMEKIGKCLKIGSRNINDIQMVIQNSLFHNLLEALDGDLDDKKIRSGFDQNALIGKAKLIGVLQDFLYRQALHIPKIH